MPKAQSTKKFTLAEIEHLWEDYKNGWCFRYLISGEWKHSPMKPDQTHGIITKMERTRYSNTMSFPMYLRSLDG